MNRRKFLQGATTLPLFTAGFACSKNSTQVALQRVRPGDPSWPSAASWDALNRQVQGRLIKVESPLAACRASTASCAEVFRQLKNPYYIGDHPALTQTSGWANAWISSPSVYAVAAAETTDVVATVNFARDRNLRLVIKGGAHSYKGTSCAADSLSIWTRAMQRIEIHDAFVPRGCASSVAPQPAVSVGSGAIWAHVYDAVTTQAGRYVQGGGCTTVGVAGLVQSGGFGSFSKNYGMAAAGLLEAEIVTADGTARIANACKNPDLFWALKGGGGGSFGVITRLTLRTRDLPEYFGGTFGRVKANSPDAWRRLIARMIAFYHERLFNPHWGEQVRFEPGHLMHISMVFQGLTQQQAREVWQPFVEWIEASPRDFVWEAPLTTLAIPARHFWDAKFLQQNAAAFIYTDDRPNAPAGNFGWMGDRAEAGQFIHGYRSAWLPAALLESDRQTALVDALVASSGHWLVSLHFNKGLAGAPASELAAAKDIATNPAVLDAFALAIIAGNSEPAFPGMPGHEPDLAAARRHAEAIDRAMNELLKVAPQRGSYVAESNFFEPEWQQSFWGANHARLAAVKKTYDPAGLFFVHQGVGSEAWSADGFTKLEA